MDTVSMHDQSYRRDLGDGLVLRWSTAADAEGLAQLYGHVFRNKEADPTNTHLGAWTHDLMSGKHPLIGAGDFALVEDTRSGAIVAGTCLLHQTLDYAGVQCEMGRPEIVASMPEYRNRGLVRSVFGLIHARCAERGYPVQGITGIPYYYRQFGYEFTIDLGGSRVVSLADVPKLKEGATEPYSLRPATLDDLPTVLALYEHERTTKRRLPGESHATAPLVTTRISAAYWRWTMDGQSLEAGEGWNTHLIVRDDGHAVGYVLTRRVRWGDTVGVPGIIVEPGVSFAAIVPSVLRALQQYAAQVPITKADVPPASKLSFDLFRAHPIYEVLGEALAPRPAQPYAWYIRVPDLPGFVQQIAPVLEQRLAESPLAGHTGELKLNFYRGGLRLAFENGRLTAVEDWRVPVWDRDASAGFPPLVFLQLLFGHRSLTQLRDVFPDVWANDEPALLLDILFPRHVSWMVNLD